MKLMAAMVAGLFLCCGSALAADNPQQNKMASCNKDAGDKKGDERKKFMSECLKKDGAPAKAEAKKPTQQEKMAACNKDAGEKKGDERKKFMSECLKK
ncbi:MAG: phosphate starvation-inducible protein [Betaproteobacteria bacterium]|nr:MAG: phosphate starvation-inducible protein [Burkholderiales bacterium]MBI3149270.1 phosphate starvation-inducible protein [Betaproteobacteria bacterium]CAG1011098.1 Phosphate starvation-inducible protein PsiF [Burkholderiales bacterium]